MGESHSEAEIRREVQAMRVEGVIEDDYEADRIEKLALQVMMRSDDVRVSPNRQELLVLLEMIRKKHRR